MEPGTSAVICLDGIVNSTLKKLTPDISWADYVARLSARRPDLDVIHLQQPYDWREILSGQAAEYQAMVQGMADELLVKVQPHWHNLVVLGFSLGGLTALNLVHLLSQQAPELRPRYLAFVTFGAPFGGTGYLGDEMLKRLHVSYLSPAFDRDSTKLYMRELLDFAKSGELRILLGYIDRDELVAQHSAWLPADWLYFAEHPRVDGEAGGDGRLKWGTFTIKPYALLRRHDGLLHDPDAMAYIDGLVDGLLPED